MASMLSCKKDSQNPATPPPIIPGNPDTTIVTQNAIDVPSNVFIVGLEYGTGFYALKYWNNGKATTLNDSIIQIIPTSIYVAGSDVYITGYEFLSNFNNSVAEYWKNGNLTVLTDSLNKGVANSVFVSGSDIYIAGSESDRITNVVKYWKNGVLIPLLSGPIGANATSIFVAGTDVYVAGGEIIAPSSYYSAIYWKNGNKVILGDGLRSAQATSITVSGNDVYVAGDEFTGTHTIGKYWKNGVGTELAAADSFDQHTTAIGVLGNDVYVTGYEYNTAVYWKNGIPVDLTNGATEAKATSICISGSDVYISGYDNRSPKYWKNGIVHTIEAEPWYKSGSAYSIFVTQ